jgi:hypothetical protein
MALVRSFGHTRDRATSFGMVAALLTTIALIVASFLIAGVPPILLPLIVGLVAAVVGVAIARLELPGHWLRAWEAYSWLGRRELDRVTANTGARLPTRVEDMEAWLAATPSSPVMRLPRGEVLAFLGHFDEARHELAMVPPDEPDIRLQIAGLRQYVDWLEHGEVALDDLRAATEAMPASSDGRREGEVMVATADARGRAVTGDLAWFEPLTAVRAGLGSAPRWVVWRDTWRPRAVLYFGVGLVGGLLAGLLAPLL